MVSDDDGFSWTPPKWTNIWGYPPDMIPLSDGRYLMIYGYRRPPYGTRGIVSEDGLTWDVKKEFVIREGGVPGNPTAERPGPTPVTPSPPNMAAASSTGRTPASTSTSATRSVAQLPDGTVVASYHEWDEADRPLQYVLCTRFRVER